jgi:hypothetical protein
MITRAKLGKRSPSPLFESNHRREAAITRRPWFPTILFYPIGKNISTMKFP